MLDTRDLRISSLSQPDINGDWKFDATHLPTGFHVTTWGKDRALTRKTAIEQIERKLCLENA